MKRSKLKKKSTVGKVKAKIQHWLLEEARKRDVVCQFAKYPEAGKCGGITTADHIITRQNSRVFADLDNIILLCYIHHIIWKPINPTIYTMLVKDSIGQERYYRIHEKAREPMKHTMGLKDWEKVLENLEHEV